MIYFCLITDGNNPQQGQENRDPLPNPWSPSEARGSNPTTPTTQPSGTTGTTQTPGARTGGILGSPGVQAIFQQMMDNPQLMQNMLSAPYTQSMLQAFAADPNVAAQIINSNPLYADNPAIQVGISILILILLLVVIYLTQFLL